MEVEVGVVLFVANKVLLIVLGYVFLANLINVD